MSIRDAVQERFGNAAAEYAKSRVHVGGADLEAMVEAAGLTGAERVLDVGTGAGHTAFAFASGASRVDALDLTPAMLDQTAAGAEARGLANVHCRLGDAEALPFEDASFDVVATRVAAHHFPRVDRFVAESARVLRPGGRLLVVDSMPSESPYADTFFNAFELLRDPSHVRNRPPSRWLSMLVAAGFAGEVLGHWPMHQDFDDWVARIDTPPTAVAHLRWMFEHAHEEVRREFAIETGEAIRLVIPVALLRGRLPA